MLQHWPQGLQIGHNVQHLLVTWGRLKSFFSISTFSPGVMPPGLISTFAPIGMLDLGWTLALTPSVKWPLWSCYTLEVSQSNFRVIDSQVIVAATHREVPTSKSYMNPCADADVEGEVSQIQLTLFFTSKSTKSEEFYKQCQRWLSPVENRR